MSEEKPYDEIIKDYTHETLLEVLSHIDRHQYPDRYDLLCAEIERRKSEVEPADPHEQNEQTEAEGLTESAEVESVPEDRRRLNGWIAFLVFIVFAAVNFAVVIGITIVAGVIAGLGGMDLKDPASQQEFAKSITPPASVVSIIVSILVVIRLSRYYARDLIRDRSPCGIGWRLGDRKNLIIGILAGCGFAVLYLLLAVIVFTPDTVPTFTPDSDTIFTPDTKTTMGPLAEMSTKTGLARWCWLIIALLLAPPSEEFLFRGVMLGGFTRSMGPRIAAVLVTILFVALHIPEAIYYWPALIGIGAMAILTLAMRIRCRALGPAIAAHFGYNLILVCTVLIFV